MTLRSTDTRNLPRRGRGGFLVNFCALIENFAREV